jgi:hypothetical protein
VAGLAATLSLAFGGVPSGGTPASSDPNDPVACLLVVAKNCQRIDEGVRANRRQCTLPFAQPDMTSRRGARLLRKLLQR